MQGISVSYNDPENIRDDEEEAVPYKGLVKDGVIVLDDAIVLPEDPILRVELYENIVIKPNTAPAHWRNAWSPLLARPWACSSTPRRLMILTFTTHRKNDAHFRRHVLQDSPTKPQ